jgi:hypothetical protein
MPRSAPLAPGPAAHSAAKWTTRPPMPPASRHFPAFAGASFFPNQIHGQYHSYSYLRLFSPSPSNNQEANHFVAKKSQKLLYLRILWIL